MSGPALTRKCPFPPCHARPRVNPQSADEARAGRGIVERHETDPGGWFGACPASLMHYPISMQAEELLAQQEAAYDRMWRERRDRERETRGESKPPAPAAPGPAPRWFTPPKDRPRLRLVAQPEQQGDTMTSVAEVQAAIAACNQVIEEAAGLAAAAGEKFTAALAMSNSITQQTLQELGRHALESAKVDCDSAIAGASVAIAINNHYGGSL